MQSDSDKSKYLFLLCFIDYASFGLPYLRVNLRGLSHEEHRSWHSPKSVDTFHSVV